MYNMSGGFAAQHDLVSAPLPSTEELHKHFLAAGQAADEADITLPGSVQADVPLLARGVAHRLDVTLQQGAGVLAPAIPFTPLRDLLRHVSAAAVSSDHDEHAKLAGTGEKAAVPLFDKGFGHAAQQEHLTRVLAASHDPAVSSEALAAGTAQQATHAVTAARHAAHQAAEHEGLSLRFGFDDWGGGDGGGDDSGFGGGDGDYQPFIDRPSGLNGGGGNAPEVLPEQGHAWSGEEYDDHSCGLVNGVYYDNHGHPVDRRVVDMTKTYPPSGYDTDAKPFYTQRPGFIADRQGARPGDGWDQWKQNKTGNDGHLGFKARAPGLYHDMFGDFDPQILSRNGYHGLLHVIYQGPASSFMPEHVQAYGDHLDEKAPRYGDDLTSSIYWRGGMDHDPAIRAYKEAMAHTDIAQYALNTVSRHYLGRDMTADELRQHMDTMGEGKENLHDVNEALARQVGTVPQQLADLMPTRSDDFIRGDDGRALLQQEVSRITGQPLSDDQLTHYQTVYEGRGSLADVRDAAHQYVAAQEAAAREKEHLAQIKAQEEAAAREREKQAQIKAQEEAQAQASRDAWEASVWQYVEDPDTPPEKYSEYMEALFDSWAGSQSGPLPAVPQPVVLTQAEKDQQRAQWQEQLNNSLADHDAMTGEERRAEQRLEMKLDQRPRSLVMDQEGWPFSKWRFSALSDFLAGGVENTEQGDELGKYSSNIYFQVNRGMPVNTTLDDLLNTKAAWNLATHYLSGLFHSAEHVTQEVARDFWQTIFPNADAAGRSKEEMCRVTQARVTQLQQQFPQLAKQTHDIFEEMKGGYDPDVSLSASDRDQINRYAVCHGYDASASDLPQLRMILARSEGMRTVLQDALSHEKDQAGHEMGKVLAAASQQEQDYCYEAAAQSMDRGGTMADALKVMVQTSQELHDHPLPGDGLKPYKTLVIHSEQPTRTSVKQQTSRDDTPFLTKSFSDNLSVTAGQVSEMQGRYVHTGFSRDPDIGVKQMATGYVPQGKLTRARKAELLAEDSQHHLTEEIIKAKKPFDYAGENNSSGLTMGDGLDLSQHYKSDFITWEVGPRKTGMSKEAYNELREHSYAKQILDKVDDRFFSPQMGVPGARGEYAEYLREATGLSLTHNQVDFLQTIYDRHILHDLMDAYDYSHGAGAWENLPTPIKEVLVNVMVSKPEKLLKYMRRNNEDLSKETNIDNLVEDVINSKNLNSRVEYLESYVRSKRN